jgi:hypothetical protein
MRSRDRGRTWEKISPDLARLNPAVPANLDPVTAKDIDQPMTDRFGVVYTIGPSPLQAATVWVGTDDGLIYVTRDDGKNWVAVTPPEMTAWSKVSQIEAGHFDAETAYASVDRHRLGDNKPYIYRTHDGGKTWQNVVAGIPEGAYVNSVKEDPQTKGLLYAATELRVYVSFNDGDAVAAVAEQHAGHLGARHRGARRRSGGRHPRPRFLGAGPDERAAADRCAGRADRFRQRLPLQAWGDLRHPGKAV